MSSLNESNSAEQAQQQAELKKQRDAVFAAAADERFHANMVAFRQYFPDICQTFVHYQPSDKFKMFVNANGTANIVNQDTNLPMYTEDPLRQIGQQVKRSVSNPDMHHIDFSFVADAPNEGDFVHLKVSKAVAKQFDLAKANLMANRQVDSHIPSQVILGIGLGYHLMPLSEVTTASYISIFEPNNDYFYASLYCFDWKTYLEAVDANGSFLFIGIGDSEDAIYDALYHRTREIGPLSVVGAWYYLHYPSKAMLRIVEKIKSQRYKLLMSLGFFDDALMSVAHTLGVLEKKPAFLKVRPDMAKSVTDYPVFIVANGPSLDNDIELLKQEQGNAIIVACNSATTALLAHGITPDFHVALERTKSTYDFISVHTSAEQRKSINLLVLNVMHPEVLDLFDWTGVGLKDGEAGSTIYQLGQLALGKDSCPIPCCNPLVGNTALSFFTHLGFSSIYLFGNDNGYAHKGHHHSKASYYFDDEGDSVYDPITMGDDFEVEGNFGGVMRTEPFLYIGKEQMEVLLSLYKDKDMACFNCSDGVKIDGAIPLRSEMILLDGGGQDKSTVIDLIKQTGFEAVDDKMDLSLLLDFDKFEQICQTMVDILGDDVSSREQGLQRIVEHLQYFNSTKSTMRHYHLYILLSGEVLFMASILTSLLYAYGNSDQVVPYFNKGKAHWKAFLVDAPNLYRQQWNKMSNYGFDYQRQTARLD